MWMPPGCKYQPMHKQMQFLSKSQLPNCVRLWEKQAAYQGFPAAIEVHEQLDQGDQSHPMNSVSKFPAVPTKKLRALTDHE